MLMTPCPDPRADPVACVKWAIKRHANAVSSQTHWRTTFKVICSLLPGGAPKFLFASKAEIAGSTSDIGTFVLLDSDLGKNIQCIEASEVLTKVPNYLANDVSWPYPHSPLNSGAPSPSSPTFGVFSLPTSAIFFTPEGASSRSYLAFASQRVAEAETSPHISLEAQSEHCSLITDLIASPETIVLIAKASGLTDCVYSLGDAGQVQKMGSVPDLALYCVFMSFIEVALRVQPRATYSWIIRSLTSVTSAGLSMCEKILALLDKFKCKRSDYEVPVPTLSCKYMKVARSSACPKEPVWRPRVVRPSHNNRNTSQPPRRIVYADTLVNEAVARNEDTVHVTSTPAADATDGVVPATVIPTVTAAPASTNSINDIALNAKTNTPTDTSNLPPTTSNMFTNSTFTNPFAFMNTTTTNPFAAANIMNAPVALSNITLTNIANSFAPANNTTAPNVANTKRSRKRKHWRH
ncbi:hypothetical protein ONZ45_g11042 [Pleurotus djamor]|nr:hypothetical protein ONZ45_g11042 [Pleurotus djamor]